MSMNTGLVIDIDTVELLLQHSYLATTFFDLEEPIKTASK
jgi:hypothetical protein